MAKRLQHRGGTTAQHSTFTGAVREVTVDTDKNTLVVHDGATAGGHPLATATNFTSTGIDDNATANAITIGSDETVTVVKKLVVDTDTLVVDNTNNRVGIGTASPNSQLDVVGTVRVTNTANASNNSNIRDGGGLVIEAGNSNPMYFYTGGGEKMRITSTGNLGVGTSTPNVDLNVVASNGGNVEEIFELRNNSTTVGTGSRLRFVNSTVAGTTGNSVSISSYRNSDGDQDLLFETVGSERMRIDSSGNVSIGITAPQTYFGDGRTTLALKGTGAEDYSVLILGNYGTANDTQGHGVIRFYDNGTGVASVQSIRQSGNLSGALQFFTAPSSGGIQERMRIDMDGKVGIGTTSPSHKLTILEGGNNFLQFSQSGDASSGSLIGRSSSKDLRIQNSENANTVFWTNNTERMRIESSGLVRINNTANATYTSQLNIYSPSTLNCGIHLRTNTSGTQSQIIFGNSTNDSVGSIHTSGSSTAFNTSSDYRLKENVSYDFDATTRLKQLKPARFNFIADANTTVDGFLAHEVSDIVPEAITGEKDALQVWKEGEELPEGVSVGDNKLDENGNTIPEYQGIDQSKLVPLLVKTIQELEARITALETQP